MSDKMDVDNVCPNCKRTIDSNLQLHVIHCSRNFKLCRECKDVVAVSDMEEHVKGHEIIKCSVCPKEVQRKDMSVHEETDCAPRMTVNCDFCHMPIPLPSFQEHSHYCGSRTEPCDICGARVKLVDLEFHMKRHADGQTGPVVEDDSARGTDIEELPGAAAPVGSGGAGVRAEVGGASRSFGSSSFGGFRTQPDDTDSDDLALAVARIEEVYEQQRRRGLEGDQGLGGDPTEAVLVAIIHELVENNDGMLAMLEALLNEVDTVRRRVRVVENAAGAVDRVAVQIPVFLPFLGILFPSTAKPLRMTTAFVGILTGLVGIGTYAYSELSSDAFVVKLREFFEKEDEKHKELGSFYGVELDDLVYRICNAARWPARQPGTLALSVGRRLLPLVGQAHMNLASLVRGIPQVGHLLRMFQGVLQEVCGKASNAADNASAIERLLKYLNDLRDACRQERGSLLGLQAAIEESLRIIHSPLGAEMDDEVLPNFPGDGDRRGESVSAVVGAEGDLSEIPCDRCGQSIALDRYMRHLIACGRARRNVPVEPEGVEFLTSPFPVRNVVNDSVPSIPRVASPPPSSPRDVRRECSPPGNPDVPFVRDSLVRSPPPENPDISLGAVNRGVRSPEPTFDVTETDVSHDVVLHDDDDDDMAPIPCEVCNQSVPRVLFQFHLNECAIRGLMDQGTPFEDAAVAPESAGAAAVGGGGQEFTIPCDGCGSSFPASDYMVHLLTHHGLGRTTESLFGSPITGNPLLGGNSTHSGPKTSGKSEQLRDLPESHDLEGGRRPEEKRQPQRGTVRPYGDLVADRDFSRSDERDLGSRREEGRTMNSDELRSRGVLDSRRRPSEESSRRDDNERASAAPQYPSTSNAARNRPQPNKAEPPKTEAPLGVPRRRALLPDPVPSVHGYQVKMEKETPARQFSSSGGPSTSSTSSGVTRVDVPSLVERENVVELPQVSQEPAGAPVPLKVLKAHSRGRSDTDAMNQCAARILNLGLKEIPDGDHKEKLRENVKESVLKGKTHLDALLELCAVNGWSDPEYVVLKSDPSVGVIVEGVMCLFGKPASNDAASVRDGRPLRDDVRQPGRPGPGPSDRFDAQRRGHAGDQASGSGNSRFSNGETYYEKRGGGGQWHGRPRGAGGSGAPRAGYSGRGRGAGHSDRDQDYHGQSNSNRNKSDNRGGYKRGGGGGGGGGGRGGPSRPYRREH